MQKLDKSALFTVVGILIFFSISVAITVVAPSHIDPSWTTPSSSYQEQMYEISDPHTYISTSATGNKDISVVYHMQKGKTLTAFQETEQQRKQLYIQKGQSKRSDMSSQKDSSLN